MYLLFRYQKLL